METKKEVYTFIIQELVKDISDEVFSCKDFETLGKHYFSEILNNVSDSKKDDIIAILNALAQRQGKHLSCNVDYYTFLCDTIDLVHIPKDVLAKINGEYQSVFVKMYGETKQKYDDVLTEIELQKSIINSKINNIGSQQHKFLIDISTDIEKLRNYYRLQNELRTKESIVKEYFEYLENKLGEYCNFNDEGDVIKKNRELAIECSLRLLGEENVEDRFLVYKHFISACNYAFDNYENLCFDIKINPFLSQSYKIIRSYSLSQEEKEKQYYEAIDHLYNERDKLKESKKNDYAHYNENLSDFIVRHSIIKEINNYIESLICLDKRVPILRQTLKLYEEKKNLLFINIVPIQIEGIFADLQDDIRSFEQFLHCTISPSADLKQKIDQIQNSIPFECAQYFKHYFNNLTRNIVAHGRIVEDDVSIYSEVLAKELLLDLHSLLYMASRNSEAEKMHRFINGYIKKISMISSSTEKHYMALYNDLIGERVFLDYDSVDKYSPIKVVFWIVNPYYEKLYNLKTEDGDTSLYELRELLLSKEFWEYAKEQTQKYCEWHWYEDALRMLSSIIKGLLSCEVSEETKDIMIDILKILKL